MDFFWRVDVESGDDACRPKASLASKIKLGDRRPGGHQGIRFCMRRRCPSDGRPSCGGCVAKKGVHIFQADTACLGVKEEDWSCLVLAALRCLEEWELYSPTTKLTAQKKA